MRKDGRRGPGEIVAGRIRFAGRIAGKLEIGRAGRRVPLALCLPIAARRPIGPVLRAARAKGRLGLGRLRPPLALPRTREVLRMAGGDGLDLAGLARALAVPEEALREAADAAGR